MLINMIKDFNQEICALLSVTCLKKKTVKLKVASCEDEIDDKVKKY